MTQEQRDELAQVIVTPLLDFVIAVADEYSLADENDSHEAARVIAGAILATGWVKAENVEWGVREKATGDFLGANWDEVTARKAPHVIGSAVEVITRRTTAWQPADKENSNE